MPTIIECMFYLQIKHFLIDWFLQFPYEYKNKGTYGHWGGIRHAFKNGFGTAICFFSMGRFLYIFIDYVY
ncbi:MAG: hypothetical protein NTZ20_05315 [Candidatus Levybacteria bacterium]|nr:hypothetical protein [Candidatus Levybacteria bacterium]